MQLLIDLANNVFGKGDYDKNKVKILSTSSTSKDPIKAGYLTFGTKKGFNFLWHTFTKRPIFQHFNQKWHIQTKIIVSG